MRRTVASPSLPAASNTAPCMARTRVLRVDQHRQARPRSWHRRAGIVTTQGPCLPCRARGPDASGSRAGDFGPCRTLPAPSSAPRSVRDPPSGAAVSRSFPAVAARSAALPGFVPRQFPDAFERRDALARGFLERRQQLARVVGDQLGAVARAADLDIEALLRGQVRVARLPSPRSRCPPCGPGRRAQWKPRHGRDGAAAGRSARVRGSFRPPGATSPGHSRP